MYNLERVSERELPASLIGFTDSIWTGRIGWAPANASLQAMVAAMRVITTRILCNVDLTPIVPSPLTRVSQKSVFGLKPWCEKR